MSEFEEKGWFLSPEGIELLKTEHPEAKTLQDCIQCAKDVRFYLVTSIFIYILKHTFYFRWIYVF